MYKFILTDNEIREKMLKFLKPILCSPNCPYGYHINWAKGVYDEEKDIFLTLIYYVPDGLSHCNWDLYEYIVIVGGNTVFSVTDNIGCYSTVEDEFKIPDEYREFSETVKDGIKHYSSFEEMRSFEKKIADTGEIPDYYKYYTQICAQMESRLK